VEFRVTSKEVQKSSERVPKMVNSVRKSFVVQNILVLSSTVAEGKGRKKCHPFNQNRKERNKIKRPAFSRVLIKQKLVHVQKIGHVFLKHRVLRKLEIMPSKIHLS